MGEKKEGKENKKCSTMPDVLIKGYKILRTVRVGQDFSIAEVEHKKNPQSSNLQAFEIGAKELIRTTDQRLMSPLLYH